MNPLSAHPPRTPRSSTATQSHFRNMSMSISVYDEKAEDEQDGETVTADKAEVDEDEVVELDEEDVRVKEAEKLVGIHEVWRDMLVTSNGRDKAFKLMQYSMNVYLLFHSKILFRSGKSAWQREIVRRLMAAKNGFSFTRKMLIMFNWLAPLSQVLAQQSVPFSSFGSSLTAHSFTATSASSSKYSQLSGGPFLSHPVLRALLSAPPPVLLELVNGLSDDIYSLSRLGLIGPKLGGRAARFADWFQSRAYKESLSGATSKSQPKASKIDERELTRLQKRSYWLQASRAKLAMDLIFVCNVILIAQHGISSGLKGGRTLVQSLTGFAAAVLSSAKLYDKYRTALVNKALTS
ncbi:hypothetical protein F4604DRAFT_1875947 [Suillus subluteus]|nr:hypothetical protein F4604DRAFT_1875947 [Suillus subluteus]